MRGAPSQKGCENSVAAAKNHVSESPRLSGVELFSRVLALCGLAELIGPGVLQRALRDAGVNPLEADAREYRRALPKLHARLLAYLSEQEADERVRRIATFLKLYHVSPTLVEMLEGGPKEGGP
jgi:hypothetical protein